MRTLVAVIIFSIITQSAPASAESLTKSISEIELDFSKSPSHKYFFHRCAALNTALSKQSRAGEDLQAPIFRRKAFTLRAAAATLGTYDLNDQLGGLDVSDSVTQLALTYWIHLAFASDQLQRKRYEIAMSLDDDIKSCRKYEKFAKFIMAHIHQ